MAEQRPRVKRKIYVGLRYKLLTLFILLFTVILGATFLWFLAYSERTALENVRTDMTDMLSGAIAGIDGDEFRALATQENKDDPRVVRHREWLQRLHSLEPRAFPYTYIRGTKPGEVLFIGDIDEDPAEFREPYVYSGPNSPVDGLDQLTVNTAGFTDKWGSWVAAYRPILDSQGNKVGAMGVDFTTAYVDEIRMGVLDKLVIAFALTYVILITLVVIIARQVTKPIIALTQIADAIGEGKYDHDFGPVTGIRFPDEIVKLAGVLESMAIKVRSREEELKSQVVGLQIIIDETRRQQQVTEVVESEFFRDLQSKAARFRANRSTADDGQETPEE